LDFRVQKVQREIQERLDRLGLPVCLEQVGERRRKLNVVLKASLVTEVTVENLA
jgi:hypothetical protein